jgi:hypothetical protein
MSKLCEKERRRPDFVPGAPVTLADGQVWELRRPVIRFIPDDNHASGFQVRLSLGADNRFGELIAQRDAAFGGEGTAEITAIVGIELALARLMLLANYDLTAEQVGTLLQFGYDEEADPEGAALRDAVLDVAFGRGPKPPPGGTAPSPMPPGP